MKRTLTALAVLLGAYLVVRAAAEPFVVDVTDASTYHLDWGGPSLAGVLAVHVLPGVVALALFVRAGVRRLSGSSRPASRSRAPRP